MKELLLNLGLSNYVTFEELPNCSVCNLDKDKILIICSLRELKEMDKITNRLPSLRKRMMQEINNQKNIELVQKEKIPMSNFLWDMYVVAIHKVDEENKVFKAADIATYERDRFIARKIIIQYEHIDELKLKFDQLIFPEKILNAFPMIDIEDDEDAVDFEFIRNLLRNIEKTINEED